MAAKFRRSNVSPSSFIDDPQLQQYFLDGVRSTGKELGRGSYGSVIEVLSYCVHLIMYKSFFCYDSNSLLRKTWNKKYFNMATSRHFKSAKL